MCLHFHNIKAFHFGYWSNNQKSSLPEPVRMKPHSTWRRLVPLLFNVTLAVIAWYAADGASVPYLFGSSSRHRAMNSSRCDVDTGCKSGWFPAFYSFDWSSVAPSVIFQRTTLALCVGGGLLLCFEHAAAVNAKSLNHAALCEYMHRWSFC